MDELPLVQVIARHLAVLGVDWSIEWSTYTGQFWINSGLYEGDGVMLAGITEHRSTPEQTLVAFFDRLRDVAEPNFIVTNDTDRDKRKHWRWNGVCFQEVPRG